VESEQRGERDSMISDSEPRLPRLVLPPTSANACLAGPRLTPIQGQHRVLKTPLSGIFPCDMTSPKPAARLLKTPLGGGFPAARLNMMRADGAGNGPQPVGAGIHPMAAEIIRSTPKPQFSGNAQDSPKFKRNWHKYLAVMQNCSAAPSQIL